MSKKIVVDFFNRINLIYGTVSEYCNETTCPTMSGGPRYEYLWADGETFKKPTPLPAPKYIEYLMDWTESQINNEKWVECGFKSQLTFDWSQIWFVLSLIFSVFPVTTDVPFPKTFINLCRKILTRLFRVFVHVYIHHFDRIVSIGAVRIVDCSPLTKQNEWIIWFFIVSIFMNLGGPREHMLQAFLLFCSRIRFSISQRAGAIGRNDCPCM